MKRLFKAHYIFLGCLILFALLLFKDPFSVRTLIPNFEPYPDAIHYVNSARSFLKREGLNIVREGRVITPSVPPLYSLSLLPAFIINNDPRVFYFTNVVLALASFVIFYLILIRLVGSSLIKGFILLLYATNYFFYWFPTLAMAENLTLFFFLSALLVLISKISLLNVVLAGVLSVSFYVTKYASAPLTAVFSFMYFIKLFLSWKKKELRIVNVFLLILSTLLALSAEEYLTKGNALLSSLISFSSNISTPGISQANTSPWFSTAYTSTNLGHYINAITGGSERFLWDFTPLVPGFVGIGGLLGLLGGIFIKQYRLVSVTLLLALAASVLFMSTFYAVDMRYIYPAIPTLLLGFGILLQTVVERIRKQILKKFFYAGVLILAVFYLSTSALRIKNQIMLNLRYAETPWYYVSVLELNKYFTQAKIQNGKKPVVITPMIPYYIDFFSNGNYTLLPLSNDQEFRHFKEAAWGSNDYSDLIALYKKYLNDGYPVYVDRYGVGNEGYLNQAFKDVGDNFWLEKVASGCYEQCDIYELYPK